MKKLAKVLSFVTVGLDAAKVEVEVDVGAGIPSLLIVGLPDKAVEESKERVRLALKNSGFSFPQKKIVINLAPADIKKEGPIYDLPIAIGVLVADGLVSEKSIENTYFAGELSLSGKLRPVRGVIQASILAKSDNSRLVLPKDNAMEANLISGIEILCADSLKQVVQALISNQGFSKTSQRIDRDNVDFGDYDFANIVGQDSAKRALEIAAAGGHNVLMDGPPGGGKTLLSKSIVSILPDMTENEILEVTKIYSISGLLTDKSPVIATPPFRSPHHTTSAVAIIGGGANPKPGEVSLANKGVLFLDEFPEFPRSVLESLRQPLEDGVVTVSRASATHSFPSDFILVAAKNPCPCGYLGDPKKDCICPMNKVISYNQKISGPLLDRMDLHIYVDKIPLKKIRQGSQAEASDRVRERVSNARAKQRKRSKNLLKQERLNCALSKNDIDKVANLNEGLSSILEQACDRLNLSMRTYLKTIKVARTIADLSESDDIKKEHILEALQYRHKPKSEYGL